MSDPTFLYKLIPSSSPPATPLPERLPLDDLDTKSGFIHLSTGIQVPKTLKHFFADVPRVYILRIPYEGLAKDIRWESPTVDIGADGLFPHLFNGGRLGNGEVESIEVLDKTTSGWDEALTRAKAWLVY